MANKLAHLVVEGNTYDIQDEELTNKFDGMTIELSLSNDYIITATLKDGNNTTLSTATIDLPSENSIVSLGYDTTTNEIIGIYRDDTVSVPHRIRVALSNLQEKLTAGQNISITNNTVSLLGLGEASTETVTGIATLDSGGKVPSSQLPSYVDDVLEYSTLQDFPVTGEAGKIYVTLDTNKTYRWTGSVYVEISQGVVLGETEYTAYRGDRGKVAYDHATAKGSAFQSGLYKITTNSEGHVTNATAVQKSDITALGIPAQDTTYNSGVATEIDNNNNVNVKYDSDTLEVDSQNRLKVKTPSQTYNFNEAIENVNGTVNVRYKGGNWNIGRNSQTNQLTINGKFVKQVEDLDAYTDAPDGEIVEYIGETDENYTNGYFYKFRSGIEYKSITIPANKKIVTIYHPDGTQEIGYEIDEELSINSAAWRTSNISSIEPINGGILTNSADWYPYFNSEIAKVGDKIWVKNGNEYIWGEIVGWFWYINLYNYSTSSESINRQIPQSIAESTSKEEATSKILQWLTENGYPQPTIYTVDNIKVKVLLDNGESYYLSSNGAGGYSSINAVTLISPAGKKIFVRTDNVSDLNIYKSTEIRKKGSEYYWYIDPDYNYPTYYTVDTLSESITLKVPVLYEEDGSLKNINSQNLAPSYWQRIDVQPIGVQSYNDLSNKPLSVVNGEVKYTLSDGTTQLTLAQKSELATVATSGSYNDLTDTPTIPTSYNDLTDKPTIPTITFRQWNTTE